MDIIQLVDNMPEDVYLRLKHAAETGKWPEGTPVDKAQQASALQLSMAYQSRRLHSEEMATIGSNGELIHKSKAELKQTFKIQEQDLTAAGSTSNVNNPTHSPTNANDIARFSDI